MRRIIILGFLAIVSGFAFSSPADAEKGDGDKYTGRAEKTHSDSIISIDPEPRSVKNYTVGQRLEAKVGQLMIHGLTYRVLPGFRAVRAFRNISRGSSWRCNHKTAEGDYLCEGRDVSGNPVNAVITSSGGLKGFAKNIVTPHSSLPGGMESGIFVPKEIPLKKPSLDWQLIYSGKRGSSINISYRELVDGMSRPSFHQALTYDLTESKDITCKTIQIEVYDATDESIVFAVKRDK